jgi:hypothetical protein
MTGLRGNGSRCWAGAEKGDETWKEKQIGYGKLGPKIRGNIEKGF